MASSRLLFFSFIIGALSALVVAQPPLLNHFCQNDYGTYSPNSSYKANLDHLLSSLPNSPFDYGFYNASYGKNSDQVCVIGLCRGDISLKDCRSCLNDSRYDLIGLCPNQKEAIGWYDTCMLRYTNHSTFGELDTIPSFDIPNPNNASDQFNQDLQGLFKDLRARVSLYGNSVLKFAVGNATVRNTAGASSQNIYALVQCTPDLSTKNCSDCLVNAFQQISSRYGGKEGGRVFNPSCNFRFETFLFFNSVVDSAPPLPPVPPSSSPESTPPTTAGKGERSNTSRIVIIVVATLAASFLLLSCLIVLLRVRKSRRIGKGDAEDGDNDDIPTVESLQYDFGTVRAATNGFSDENKLGSGGFGAVYRGTLPDGQEIAVKRLGRNSRQGATEFKNEVLLVARLQHRNLVRLLGFCLEGDERLLIYEYVPNGSLDRFIFDPTKRNNLDWASRFNIIEGIARGLLYLHQDSRLRIVHRDLKPSNVLLDGDMNPKISDFGMAKLFDLDQTQDITSRIAGTYGYMAPEYAIRGRISIKSDVFSFGILILEIVIGQRNNNFCTLDGEEEDMISLTWKSWKDGILGNVVDPMLKSSSTDEIMRCIHIGLLCVQNNMADRPTMATVALMLNSPFLPLPAPSEPTFFPRSISESGMSTQQDN